MKRIISSLHFAWGDLDDCFRRARDELQLDGVEFPVRDDLGPFARCMADLSA